MKHLSILLLLLVAISCRTNYRTYNNQNYSKASLPGTIKLPNGLRMDETEITNFNWMEYLYWTGRVYGKHSEEYKKSLPDENCWIELDTSYFVFTLEYLRHPAFRDYPVVGISQEQAEAFSKWRSDRVFEAVLIASGVIEWVPSPGPDDHFTIERYFRGEYLDKKVDSNHLYYPVYTLPSFSEWNYAVQLKDSLLKDGIKSAPLRKKINYKEGLTSFRCGYAGVKLDSTFTESSLTSPVFSGIAPKYTVYNLKGNVSEWICEPNSSVGGGWYNTRAEILKDPVFRCDSANAWTGFRNVAHWEKWER